MDIPESGAVFTLGKSHLSENTQSYFYIKGDPVTALKSGEHQSAVICGIISFINFIFNSE